MAEGESRTELEVLLMKKNNSLRNGHQSCGPKQVGPQSITNSNAVTQF